MEMRRIVRRSLKHMKDDGSLDDDDSSEWI